MAVPELPNAVFALRSCCVTRCRALEVCVVSRALASCNAVELLL